MRINVLNIARLADKELLNEFSTAGVTGLPDDIQAALNEQLAEDAKARAKAAASEIIKLFRKADEVIEHSVLATRNYRAALKREKAFRDKINRAKAYGVASRNFIPLAILLNQANKNQLLAAGVNPNLFEVPSDFQVEESAE